MTDANPAGKPIAPVKPSKGARTRALLTQSVIDLVNSRPIDDIKIADICAPIGLAVGAFYFHFASKDDALDKVAVGVINDVFEQAIASPHSDDLFSEIVGILSEFYRVSLEERLKIRAVFIIIQTRHPVRLAWLEIRRRLIARLVARFARERTSAPGAFASDHVLAHFLTGALERFYDDVFFLPPESELPAIAANYDVFVRQQALVWVRAISGGT